MMHFSHIILSISLNDWKLFPVDREMVKTMAGNQGSKTGYTFRLGEMPKPVCPMSYRDTSQSWELMYAEEGR